MKRIISIGIASLFLFTASSYAATTPATKSANNTKYYVKKKTNNAAYYTKTKLKKAKVKTKKAWHNTKANVKAKTK